jgi:hypothetical protein
VALPCICRRIPYVVAMKHRHGACAALLNPTSAEPLVWPSPLKFIGELNQEAKALLEQALMEANREREKSILKGTAYSLPSPSPSHSDVGVEDNISEVCFLSVEFFLSSHLTIVIIDRKKKGERQIDCH